MKLPGRFPSTVPVVDCAGAENPNLTSGQVRACAHSASSLLSGAALCGRAAFIDQPPLSCCWQRGLLPQPDDPGENLGRVTRPHHRQPITRPKHRATYARAVKIRPNKEEIPSRAAHDHAPKPSIVETNGLESTGSSYQPPGLDLDDGQYRASVSRLQCHYASRCGPRFDDSVSTAGRNDLR